MFRLLSRMLNRGQEVLNSKLKKGCFFAFLMVQIGATAQQLFIGDQDQFLSMATDARAAGQGDVGVATAPDVYSQQWNPAKYIFSEKKVGFGLTQILGAKSAVDGFAQANVNFYNQPDERSAYGVGIRGYSYSVPGFSELEGDTNLNELAIDGSYALKLGEYLSMAVTGRYILINRRTVVLNGFFGQEPVNLFGIDVSSFYFGKEIGYKNYNGRWRAALVLSNLRNKPSEEDKLPQSYVPSTLKAGVGFDFILDSESSVSLTTEYTALLVSYRLENPIEFFDQPDAGSILAIGFEGILASKLVGRAGYSQGLNRRKDTFLSLGVGVRSKYADFDMAYILGDSIAENPLRTKLRVSISIDLAAAFSNQGD